MEALKRAAGERAAAEVPPGSVVGLGSGSTMAYAIAALGRRVRVEGLEVTGVPTSYQARVLALEHGIPLREPGDVQRIDLALDGADAVDPRGNAIKGAGAAHVTEKVVAALADSFVLVVDTSKLVSRLGESCPIPLEVVPPALGLVLRRVTELGGSARLRVGTGKVGPVVSDLGNLIVDATFGAIDDLEALDRALNGIPGVVGHGLFVGMADRVLVARGQAEGPEGVEVEVRVVAHHR